MHSVYSFLHHALPDISQIRSLQLYSALILIDLLTTADCWQLSLHLKLSFLYTGYDVYDSGEIYDSIPHTKLINF